MTRSRHPWKRLPEDNSQAWIRFFLFICFLAFVLVTYSLFKETYKKYQIQKEVNELRQQAQELEQGNQKLRGLIDYFGTQNYSEKEARQKLNVKKEGESVVILKSPDDEEAQNSSPAEEGRPQDELINLPNPLKWWEYFFRPRPQIPLS